MLGLPVPAAIEEHQGVHVRRANQDNIPAIATVTAGRTAFGHVLLAPPCQSAVAAIACADHDLSFIFEHGQTIASVSVRAMGDAKRMTAWQPTWPRAVRDQLPLA